MGGAINQDTPDSSHNDGALKENYSWIDHESYSLVGDRVKYGQEKSEQSEMERPSPICSGLADMLNEIEKV